MNALEKLFADHGIRNIVHLPADDLTGEEYHVWLHSGWLAEHCGRGPTIKAAIDDAIARRMERAA